MSPAGPWGGRGRRREAKKAARSLSTSARAAWPRAGSPLGGQPPKMSWRGAVAAQPLNETHRFCAENCSWVLPGPGIQCWGLPAGGIPDRGCKAHSPASVRNHWCFHVRLPSPMSPHKDTLAPTRPDACGVPVPCGKLLNQQRGTQAHLRGPGLHRPSALLWPRRRGRGTVRMGVGDSSLYPQPPNQTQHA